MTVCINIHDLGYIEIKFSQFKELPEEIASRISLYSLMAIGGKCYNVKVFGKLIVIFNEISQKNSAINRTFSGW